MSSAPTEPGFRRAGKLVGGPVGFRRRLERLGPTFIKLGQFLALRPDLIPQAYCDELMVLFDRVAPFAWSDAEAILREEFGAEPREVFAEIDPVPFAAGAVAQTHLARLGDGTVVAVKIQRPLVREQIVRDLGRARLLARVLELSQLSPIVTPRQVTDELTTWMLQEIDFQHQLGNLTLLHRLAAESAVEVIPRPYPELSTDRVLTMEYLQGVPVSEILGRGAPVPVEAERDRDPRDGRDGYTAADVDRNELAANLLTATLQQIFRYQFFHADLHPGNLFAMPNGRVGFVDFGLCDAWDGTMRSRMLRALSAIYLGDVEKMHSALVEVLIPGEQTDLATFRVDFFAESRRWTGQMRMSLENQRPESRRRLEQSPARSPIAQWMIGVLRIARQHGFRIPPTIVSIFRALLVAEMVASRLGAGADLRSTGRDFFAKLQISEAAQALDPRNAQSSILNALTLLRDGPGEANQILSEVADGSFAITVHAVEPPRIRRTRNRRTQLIATALLSVAVPILLGRDDLPAVQGISLAWLLMALLFGLYASVLLQARRLR